MTDPTQKKQLIDASDRLTEVIERLKAVNQTNQQLIQQSLAFINYSLDLIVGTEEEPVYKNPADQHGRRRTNAAVISIHGHKIFQEGDSPCDRHSEA